MTSPQPSSEQAPNEATDWASLKAASILVVDDEPGMRNFLLKTLRVRCKHVSEASNTEEAEALLEQIDFDVIVLDNHMPGRSGIEWLTEQRQLGFVPDTIFITAYAELETAIEILRAGAADLIVKPFRSNQLLHSLARCLDRTHLQRENFLLNYEIQGSTDQLKRGGRLIGHSPAIQQVRERIARVARMPTSVLITGESGTGKEVAARSLHAQSQRADQQFVPVNCSAIPHDMLESELFGHIKGAFTGADHHREGLFRYAHEGTLFLDEIGEMPIGMQGKLLRAIEDRSIRPVGSERETPVDVRFIFATNADLPTAIKEGKFREDLYHRMNVVPVELPPLRDRDGDVVELAEMFMEQMAREFGVPPVPIGASVRSGLKRYDWPGNVRELRNMIERSLILGEFPDEVRGQVDEENMENSETLEAVERRHITAILAEVGGNRAEAARRLAVSRKTIDRKCALWGL